MTGTSVADAAASQVSSDAQSAIRGNSVETTSLDLLLMTRVPEYANPAVSRALRALWGGGVG